MNKVTTINLGGISFQLEEAGYDALRAYLDDAAARLQGNPDRDEILSDIEQAIGEKFRGLLSGYKNVILTREVEAVLSQMGPIQDDAGAASGASTTASGGGSASSSGAAQPAGTAPAPKRLYRIPEGAMIAGVCNGLAAYFNIDPTIVRLAFVLLTLIWGAGILVYIIMAIVVPQALTPDEKAAATGVPPTAQDFIRRAKQGYYEAMKSFPDRQARREWRRRFKRDMRNWSANVQREATATAQDCRRNWEHYWGMGTWNPGLGLALPVVSLLHGALVIAWICTLISLLATGTVFGVVLPVGMPVWVAVLILLFVYGMMVWPLKAARRAFYYGARGAPGAPFALFCVMDAFIWVAVVGTLLWLAVHHFPQAHEAVRNIPTVAHDMADSIRDWWNHH
ncbi:MAG TPA: PspC domain-containing protein [Opitutaceae bacterium]|nr:PspC domain-containing protein [Opitutaceae bacterium]